MPERSHVSQSGFKGGSGRTRRSKRSTRRARRSSPRATRRARSCVTGSPARLLLALGRPLDASKRLAVARRKLLDGQSDPAELASCEQQLAAVLHSLGRDRDVVTLLVSARELFTKADRLRDAGVCDNDLGVLRAKAGELDVALDHFADARAVLREQRRGQCQGSRVGGVQRVARAVGAAPPERRDGEGARGTRRRSSLPRPSSRSRGAIRTSGCCCAEEGRLNEAADRLVGAPGSLSGRFPLDGRGLV